MTLSNEDLKRIEAIEDYLKNLSTHFPYTVCINKFTPYQPIDTTEGEYVRCVKWNGDLYTAGKIYHVVNGIIIDNTFISGFLYYHLNFFKCQLDILESGKVIRKLANPYLRDNEWIIDSYIRQAEDAKKGLCILGSRRLAKSVFEASYITHRHLCL
jgi:hypothetical protein